MKLGDVLDGLSVTFFASERHNGKFFSMTSGHHLYAETVWVGAIKEGEDDDHAHTTLFQTGRPSNSPFLDDGDAASRHGEGVHALFGDGSVRFLANTIDLDLYRALSTRDGRETLTF
jgi:prepilin-type processing-associated H-X9-DG protein